jgi:hypothetical protein
MLAQGVLGFQYEAETSSGGLTSLAGLPLYLDLIHSSGLGTAIRRRVQVAGNQGWLDIQMVLAVIFLNLAGGDCVEDLERLESDSGFAAILLAIERDLLSRAERRSLNTRWRRERQRAVPSPSALSGWLERFHDPAAAKAVAGSAFIPAMTDELRGLWRVNQALLGFMQTHQPATSATLDMDATLIETHKRDALPCYKGFKAYQPLNCWWAEQGTVLYSEFRDGNVPAGHEQLRVMKDCPRYLPASVKKVSLRSDTAAYQEELLLYRGEGEDPRFGVIDFAIGADVTAAFRAAVLVTPESEWKPLIRMVDGQPQQTDQEYAEVCYVPGWAGHGRKRADYRFLAIREPLHQLTLGDAANLPFPTQAFGQKGIHKLFGVVTNRKDAGDLVAARAMRQERGSPLGDEIRSRRRTTAIRAVRRQCGLVDADDPGIEPERRDEAAGTGQGLGDEADESASLPFDRSARTRGQPCAPAHHSPRRRGRGVGHLHHRPSNNQGIGMWTGRMKRHGDSTGSDITSRATLQDGHASPCPAEKNVTRNGCTMCWRDSPCVRRDKRGR